MQVLPRLTSCLALQHSRPFRIRRARLEDADSIARINAEVFSSQLPVEELDSPLLESIVNFTEARLHATIRRESRVQVQQALTQKRQAQQEARENRLRQRSQRMKAEIARLQGRPPAIPFLESRLERAARRSWRRKRRYACLVADDKQLGVVGSCSIALNSPEAALPPPWPTTRPLKLYLSNLAVSPHFRRRGAAKQLLHSCERIGRLWGYKELWLHVDMGNESGEALYSSAGYRQIAEDPWYWIFGKRRRLLRKELKPLVCVDEGGIYAREQYLQTQHELQTSPLVRRSLPARS
eukprot:jgi/Astpho2/9477/fgenesh1_pg.00145_%23_72_t